MSKSFRQHADEQLRHLVMTEGMNNRVRQQMRNPSSPRLRGHVLKVLVVLLLVGTLTAFAFTRGFGLFELMGTVLPHFSIVRPEAEDLVRRDLARYSFEHVDVIIREAAYDGRYLRVAYSTIDRAATAPLDEPGKPLMEGRPDIYSFTAAKQDGISWSTLDWALVNGEDVNPLGMSFAVAGPENGEAITWVQFDVRELELPNTFTVRLPIRGRDTPRELDFTMDKGGMNHVFYLQPPPDKRIGNYVVRVKEVMVSPIRMYITLHLIIDPGLTPGDIWQITNPWFGEKAVLSDADGQHPVRWTDTGAGPINNMDWVRADLPNGEFTYEDVIVDPEKPVTMRVIPEYPPPATYPETFRLGHSEEDFILIPFEKLEAPQSPSTP